MQKTDHFFIKLVVVLVVAILLLVSIVYFMQNDWSLKNTPMNDWSFTKKTENLQESSLNDSMEESSEELLLPNRRYLETKVDLCEQGVIFTCEDYEFEFSDETGCGCELTKEYIEELEMRINDEDLPLDEGLLPSDDNEMPIACTMEYAPVCGMKDGEYQTFGNDCMAEAAGVFDYTIGECEVAKPVCGNGIIEGNESCDGDALRSTGLNDDDALIWGCQPGSEIICSCKSDCTQTCHCEE